MKSLLPSSLLVLLLMFFGGKAEGQKEGECLYRCSFGELNWEVWSIIDTLVDSDYLLDPENINDTVFQTLENRSKILLLKYPFEKTFDTAIIEIRSFDGSKSYQIISGKTIEILAHDGGRDWNWTEQNHSSLNNLKRQDIVILYELKAMDPETREIFSIPSLNIKVE